MEEFDPTGATEVSSDVSFSRPQPQTLEVTKSTQPSFGGGEPGSGIDASPNEMFDPTGATEYVEPEKNFLLDPREHDEPQYIKSLQDSYDTKMLEYKLQSDTIDRINAKATEHYKSQRQAEIGDLEENWLTSVVTPGKSFEIPSINAKLNKLMSQGMDEGTAANSLLEAGVKPSELQRAYEYRNGALGYDTSFKQLVADAADWIGEDISAAANGFGQAGAATLAMMTKATIGGLGLRILAGNQLMNQANQARQAYFDGIEKAYEKMHGGQWSIPGTLAKHAVDIASLGLNPGTWGKAIITGLPFVAQESTMQGYDAAQVGAHMALAAGVTGAIAGIISTASRSTALGRKLTKSEAMDADKAYEKIRVMLGLSPEEMAEVKNLALSTKNTTYASKAEELEEFFRYMATARHIGNNKGRRAMEAVSNTIFTTNPHLSQEVMKSATNRANMLLSKVPGSTDLGKLVRTFTRHGDGNTVINWKGLADAIKDRPMASAGGQFNPSSPIIQSILKNGEVYAGNDMISQKLFESEHFINASQSTMLDEALATAKVVAETKATMGLGRLMGMTPIPRYSASRKIVDLAKSYIPGLKNTVQLSRYISSQLEKGSMSAKSLSTELRQLDPHFAQMTTAQLDPIVEKMIKLSQHTDITARELRLKNKLAELQQDSNELRLAYKRTGEDVTRAQIALAEEKTPENIATLKEAQLAHLKQKELTDTNVNDNTELALRLKTHPLPEKPADVVTELKKPTMMEAAIPKPKATETPKPRVEVAKPTQIVPEPLQAPKDIKDMEKAVRRKMAIGIDGSKASTDAQRAARRMVNEPIFGKQFSQAFEKDRVAASAKGVDDKASEDFSNYLIVNKDKVTPQQVAQYYEIDPSFVKLEDGRWGFGVPRRIQEQFGVPQKEVVVDRRIAALYKKNKDGALGKQVPDTQIDSRDELAQGGCK